MPKKHAKNVIFQKFNPKQTLLSFPYPPVYQEKQTDYICFSDNRSVRSKFWEMRYIDDFEHMDVQSCLGSYQKQREIQTNQIQMGALFSTENNAEGLVTLPSLEETPDIAFHREQMVPTADEHGNYRYRKNPQYHDGKYQGRPLLLTIGVPVSNQIDTIDRCLSHIKPLLEHLDAELLVVDTGSTDGTISVCRSYGARIIEHPWENNMSAVRNEAVYHAKGAWYLSIDDDEWFEDVKDILEFFQSGAYQRFGMATYVQRNYQVLSGSIYHDNHALRMARITPELHFEGRIHDAIIVSKSEKNCQLFSCAHHYGFAVDDENRLVQKYIRNTSILLYDVYEYPENLRYNFQLANELKNAKYYEQALAYFLRGIAIERELPDPYFGKLHVVNLLSSMHNAQDARTFAYTEFLWNRFSMTEAEKAFLNYNLLELAVMYRKPADEILHYFRQYERYRKRYEQNPFDSQQHSFLGLQACTNEPYIIDAHVLAFCAYVQKEADDKALMELAKIPIDQIYSQHKVFYKHMMEAGDTVYQAVLDKLTLLQCEQWQEELLDAYFTSILKDEIYRRQLERFSGIMRKFHVKAIEHYFCRFYQQFPELLLQRLYEHAFSCDPFACCEQELFACGFLLKEIYRTVGKKENNMELFLKYVQVTKAFASAYYYSGLLLDMTSSVLAPDIRAACIIYDVWQDGEENSQNIRQLKMALEIFPGFKSEIQYVMQRLRAPELPAQEALSMKDEMVMLAQILKKQVKGLQADGKKEEAEALLAQLAVYVPDDPEVLKMLEEVEESRC